MTEYKIVELETGLKAPFKGKWSDYIKRYKSRRNNYVPPESGLQLYTLSKGKQSKIIFDLLFDVLTFTPKIGIILSKVLELALKKTPDAEILEYIYRYLKPVKPTRPDSATYVAGSLYGQLLEAKWSPPDHKINYLDYGAGDGYLASALGVELNANIYATDLLDGFENEWKTSIETLDKEKKLTFKSLKINSDGQTSIPFDTKFDIITCNMVLHHIEPQHLQHTLNDIKNHLVKGGILILKEHDAHDYVDMIVIDLIHTMYLLQGEPASNSQGAPASNSQGEPASNSQGAPARLPHSTIDKIYGQHMYYKDMYEWNYTLSRIGFKRIYMNQTGSFSAKSQCKLGRNFIAFYQV